MRLQTHIRNCLYLNWAIPAAQIPAAPRPLRYERHTHEDEDHVLVSALLFQQDELHAEALPLVKLSFPQFNLRLYVVDDEGMPSVLFVKMLVPAWVMPAVRLMSRQPAQSASFQLRGEAEGQDTSWRWRVERHTHFECFATPGARAASVAPFASWEATVDSVRLRNRGYFLDHGHLHRVDTENHPIEAVPMRAEIADDGLVAEALGIERTPELHSAWLCPEMPLVFELAGSPRLVLPRGVPAPG